jgi:hypothetical protein
MTVRVAAIVVVFVFAVPQRAVARDGETGWIAEGAISLGGSVAASSSPPLAPAQGPDLRPRLFVEDAGQLPGLMAKDPAFAARAASLAQRRTLSYAVGGLAVVSFVAFTIAGMNDMSSPPPGDPSFGKTPGGPKLILGGMVSLLVGSVLSMAVHPSRSEVLDLLNGWNVAHPGEPLALQPPVVVVTDPPPPSSFLP